MGAGLKRARDSARKTQRKRDIVDILRANAGQLHKKEIICGAESGRLLAEVMVAAADEIDRLRRDLLIATG